MYPLDKVWYTINKYTKEGGDVMTYPERGSVLKRTMETEEKPCLHKKRGY